ncbi:MAG: ROK family glucokinase [Lachnospiraceae bacterium]|nr:ROK family glucokinase [Lachnospiraceae bacterium]
MEKRVIGVDIGGTTVKLGLFDAAGNILEKWEIPTRTENGGEKILPDIADAIAAKLAENGVAKTDVIGIGVGAPGPIDDEGVVHAAVNLGWGTFNINETLQGLTGIATVSGNDANVAALGEMWKGGGKGYRNLVVVTLGTGVGGGIIVNGQMLTGCLGAAGEIGHIHIEDHETAVCGCGNSGCLEQYASATGITRLGRLMLEKTSEPSVLRDGEVSAKAVFDAVKAGDAVAIRIAEQFGDYLGKGLAAVGSVLNPEVFVVGGGVSKAGTVLFDYIEKNYRKYVFHGSREAKFVLATLGNDAGIVGAAKLVLDKNEA